MTKSGYWSVGASVKLGGALIGLLVGLLVGLLIGIYTMSARGLKIEILNSSGVPLHDVVCFCRGDAVYVGDGLQDRHPAQCWLRPVGDSVDICISARAGEDRVVMCVQQYIHSGCAGGIVLEVLPGFRIRTPSAEIVLDPLQAVMPASDAMRGAIVGAALASGLGGLGSLLVRVLRSHRPGRRDGVASPTGISVGSARRSPRRTRRADRPGGS